MAVDDLEWANASAIAIFTQVYMDIPLSALQNGFFVPWAPFY